MGRFEHPGQDLRAVFGELKETYAAPAKGAKGQPLGWGLERRCLAACFKGNPQFSGYLWTVWQIWQVFPDGREEVHSGPWIYVDHVERYNQAWWHKPIGSESDHPYTYGCPIKYLDMCQTQNAAWRQLVREKAAVTKTKRKRNRQAKLALTSTQL